MIYFFKCVCVYVVPIVVYTMCIKILYSIRERNRKIKTRMTTFISSEAL